MLVRNDGTQLMRFTLFRTTYSQNWAGDSQIASLTTTIVAPWIRGSVICSIDGSKAIELSSAIRQSRAIRKYGPNVETLLARLVCSTTTPFGVPVEPEV